MAAHRIASLLPLIFRHAYRAAAREPGESDRPLPVEGCPKVLAARNRAELQYGVPLILDQLFEALVCEEATPTTPEDAIFGYSLVTSASVEAGRTAGLHGTELFKLGYSVEQVVHDYGDLCQAITELAKEMDAPISVDEFPHLQPLAGPIDCERRFGLRASPTFIQCHRRCEGPA
jgi:hypothetical protein